MRKSLASISLMLMLTLGLVPATISANTGPPIPHEQERALGYQTNPETPAFADHQSQDVTAVQQRFTDAVRRGDVPAAIAMLTDDATWAGTGLCAQTACVGKLAIQAEIAQQVASHVHITALSVTAHGTQVIQRAELRFDGLPVGIERIVGTATFTILADKIASFRFVPDLGDAQTLTFLKAQATRNFIRRLGDG